MLLCNDASYWLGANLVSALKLQQNVSRRKTCLCVLYIYIHIYYWDIQYIFLDFEEQGKLVGTIRFVNRHDFRSKLATHPIIVVIIPTVSSPAAPQGVIITTSASTRKDKVGTMTTIGVKSVSWYDNFNSVHVTVRSGNRPDGKCVFWHVIIHHKISVTYPSLSTGSFFAFLNFRRLDRQTKQTITGIEKKHGCWSIGG